MSVFACVSVCTLACVLVYMCTRMYVCVCVCVCVRACMCVCTRTNGKELSDAGNEVLRGAVNDGGIASFID